MTQTGDEKTVFIAMPFGERTGFLDHSEGDPTKRKTIKFDGVWKNIIKKSLPNGAVALRADELRVQGIIDRKYTRLLFEADVVVADLTFANPNVYYEVGIRQALRRSGTILIACSGTVLPFDLRSQTIHYYPYEDATRLDDFRMELQEAIVSAIEADETLSPVHVYLPELKDTFDITKTVGSRVESLASKLGKVTSRSGVLRLSHQILLLNRPTTDLLETLGVKLRKVGEIDFALQALEKAIGISPDDPEVLREIGFCYRKKGAIHHDKAEAFLKEALAQNPNDFEALGMLGGLARRRGENSTALSFYQAAHDLEPDELYPLVTLGCIHAVLGNKNQSYEYYNRCTTVADAELEKDHSNYWAYLCKGEAITVEGDSKKAIGAYQNAIKAKAPQEDLLSALEQLRFLSESGVASSTCDTVQEAFMHLINK